MRSVCSSALYFYFVYLATGFADRIARRSSGMCLHCLSAHSAGLRCGASTACAATGPSNLQCDGPSSAATCTATQINNPAQRASVVAVIAELQACRAPPASSGLCMLLQALDLVPANICDLFSALDQAAPRLMLLTRSTLGLGAMSHLVAYDSQPGYSRRSRH